MNIKVTLTRDTERAITVILASKPTKKRCQRNKKHYLSDICSCLSEFCWKFVAFICLKIVAFCPHLILTHDVADCTFKENSVVFGDSAQEVMRNGCSPVIIDNTNVQAWQMLPYVRLVRSVYYHFVKGFLLAH